MAKWSISRSTHCHENSGVRIPHLRYSPMAPDDEFPLKNMHPQPGAAVIKRLCAADAGGLSLALFVGFRPERGTLTGNLRLCIYIILSYLFNSCGKYISFPPFGQCRLRIHYHADWRCVNGLRNLAQNTKDSYEFCTQCRKVERLCPTESGKAFRVSSIFSLFAPADI